MSATVKTLVKFANVSKIMEAATFLHGLGLLDKPPNEYVKAYVLANPDINAALNPCNPKEPLKP